MSLKALEKTKHVVTQPLVTLSILIKISSRLEVFFFKVTELTSVVSVQHRQRQSDTGLCCLFIRNLTPFTLSLQAL